MSPSSPLSGQAAAKPKAPQRSRSAPGEKLGLDVAEAFASLHKPTAWTIRGKTSFGDESRYMSTGGELSADLSDKYDQIRPRAPKYTMVPRMSGITKTPDQPGPGEYKVPSTLYGSHPMLPMAGRVPRTTARRSQPNDGCPVTPSPLDYKVEQDGRFGRVDQTRVPCWSIRAKIKDPASREVRPGAYDVGICGRNGPMASPKWTMISRTSGITKTKDQPGPGEYVLPSTLYGKHPALPMAGRVPRSTAERWPSKVEERPY